MAKKVITLGDVMMRLSTPGHQRFSQAVGFEAIYGGAEANVSVALAQWNVNTSHVTAFPNHDLGKAAANYLRQMGVNISHVHFIEGRLGLYFLENGAMQRSSKIIYDRFDSAFANWDGVQLDWDVIFEGADWFHWTGITPALSESAADLLRKALPVAKAKGLKISADINYRRNLWQYGKSPLEVMPELIHFVDVVVAGLADFSNCMDIKSENFEEACQMAMEKFPQIKYITNTERATVSASENDLNGVLWNGKETLSSQKYNMAGIVDRVGGGDAFMAGLIYGLLHYEDQEALEFATAASVLKHSITGDANRVTLEEVLALVEGKNVGKLLR